MAFTLLIFSVSRRPSPNQRRGRGRLEGEKKLLSSSLLLFVFSLPPSFVRALFNSLSPSLSLFYFVFFFFFFFFFFFLFKKKEEREEVDNLWDVSLSSSDSIPPTEYLTACSDFLPPTSPIVSMDSERDDTATHSSSSSVSVAHARTHTLPLPIFSTLSLSSFIHIYLHPDPSFFLLPLFPSISWQRRHCSHPNPITILFSLRPLFLLFLSLSFLFFTRATSLKMSNRISYIFLFFFHSTFQGFHFSWCNTSLKRIRSTFYGIASSISRLKNNLIFRYLMFWWKVESVSASVAWHSKIVQVWEHFFLIVDAAWVLCSFCNGNASKEGCHQLRVHRITQCVSLLTH